MTRLAAFAIAAAACARGATNEHDLVEVRRDDLVIDVGIEGDLSTEDATDVRPPMLDDQASFKVSWLAPDGSEIAAGAPIVTFDNEDLTRALDAAKVEIDAAEKRLAKRRREVALAHHETNVQLLDAEIALTRAKLEADVPPDLIGKLERRKQVLDLELAELDLGSTRRSTGLARSTDAADLAELTTARDAARRHVDELRASIEKLTVVAPRAGTVAYPGDGNDKRKVGDSVYVLDSVVKVVGFDSMYGVGEVDEIDIGKIAVGQPLTLHFDALPDVEVHGAVRALTTTVQARSDADASNVVQVEVSIAQAGAKSGLRSGMRFRGRIETRRAPSVIQVPAEAVFITTAGPVAYRATGHGVEAVRLTLGRRSSTAIEVTSGLAAGDQVATVDPTAEAP